MVLLSTIAYLPLVAVVLLNLIVPARRVLHAKAYQDSPDEEASRDASRQTLIGVALLACLTAGQCSVLFYAVQDMELAVGAGGAATHRISLARQSD
ncbi:MAG: hypothetical protein WBL23_14685 [Salinisphaera sp.]|uniref:hypothetical protein n=1 Tax=Salinisphaera sp. TaxID=1914330 RepID=UPI003C79C61A